MKKLFEPRKLGIITICLMIISFVIKFSSYSFSVLDIVDSFVCHFVIVYLFTLLYFKNKNTSILNVVLIILLLFNIIIQFFNYGVYALIGGNFYLCLIIIIMTVGIIIKKTLPYKLLLILFIIILFISSIKNIFVMTKLYSSYHLYDLVFQVGLCFLTIFLYQWGISFKKKGELQNE